MPTIRTQQASTGGSYHIDPFGPGAQYIHGARIVSTDAVPAGTAPSTCSRADRCCSTACPVEIETGYTGDDFARKQSTLRVEERVLPAVVRPSLFMKVTLT